MLARQITSDILSETDHNKTKTILQKYFNSKTELGKELKLYQSMTDDKFNNLKNANMLIETVLKLVKKLDYKKLNKEKYDLIGEMKNTLDMKVLTKNKINNYVILASTYKLFEHEKGSNNIEPKELVEAKNHLLKHIITENKAEVSNDKQELKQYKQLSEDLRSLSYRILVEKFNDKYNGLDDNQKTLLSHFINNISNGVELKQYIDRQVLMIKEKIKKILPLLKEKTLKIKIASLLSEMKNHFKGDIAKDEHILNALRYYQILKDLKTIIKNK